MGSGRGPRPPIVILPTTPSQLRRGFVLTLLVFAQAKAGANIVSPSIFWRAAPKTYQTCAHLHGAGRPSG